MKDSRTLARPFVVAPGQGADLPLDRLGTIHKVAGSDTAGLLAIVEHTLPPGALAAPLHRHSREDELSIVLEGKLGALLGDDVVEATAGSYVLKPRHQWHTFWNAGSEPLLFIELIVPAGFEGYFRKLSPLLRGGIDPIAIEGLAANYGLEFRMEETEDICRRFGLRFG